MVKAYIVYFSGTGGTALAAEALSDSLKEKGIGARSAEIFRGNAPEPKPDEMLIMMYPVYAAAAPAPVCKWIESLKKAQNGKAAVISVSGGGEVSPNTACRAKVIKSLERKGFSVISEYMLCMPSNFITPTPVDIARELIRILPVKCALIADEIADETPNRKKPLFIDRIMPALFSAERLGSKLFGKTLKAKNVCNGCGLCAKKCPRENIVMDEGRPEFGWRCVLCMRCIYTCPKNAIHARFPILKRAVLKDGFDLKALQETAGKAEEKGIEISDAGPLWKAVAKYIGADSV